MTAFATPAELSAWTGGKISAGDPRSQPLLDGASAAIRRSCGWHVFPVVDDDVVLDGPGGSVLVLPTLHVTNVATVTVLGSALAEDEFEWSALGQVRALARPWPTRYRSIQVEFSHGFAAVPDLKQVVLQACAAALSSPMGATREQAGQVSVTWAATGAGVAGGLTLLERDLAIVDQYRLPRRA